jgi:hypothetical protein
VVKPSPWQSKTKTAGFLCDTFTRRKNRVVIRDVPDSYG